MHSGKWNVSVGVLTIAAFAAYGFLLIYLRDFAPDRAAWIEGANDGAHFEAKLAHVHGNLFALVNIVVGFILARLDGAVRARRIAAGLVLGGLLMPLGIVLEVVFGAPPVLVAVGAVVLVVGLVVTGALSWRAWQSPLAPGA